MRKINKIIILVTMYLFISIATGYCYIDYFESHNSIYKLRIPMTGRQGALQRVLKFFYRYKPGWTSNRQGVVEKVIKDKPEIQDAKITPSPIAETKPASYGIKIYEVSEEYLEGARTAKLFYDNEIWAKLPSYVKEKIKRIISRYPDEWDKGDYDEFYGTSEEKRAVKIKLKEPITVNGEEIDSIIVYGVLFREEDLGKDYRGASVGISNTQRVADLNELELENLANVDFDEKGRPILTKPLFQPLGGLYYDEAEMRFVHSSKTLPEAGLRGPIAIGYAKYGVIKKDGRSCGVFISALRRNEPERYGTVIHGIFMEYYDRVEQNINGSMESDILKQMSGIVEELDIARVIGKLYNFGELYRAYGMALRDLNDAGFYPKDPHAGNMALYISGKEKPIWYDLALWKTADKLTQAQRLAYRYRTLTYGSMDVSRDIGTPGLTLACMCKLVNPDEEFLKGYFYKELKDRLFESGLRNFKIYEGGYNSFQVTLYNPDDKSPIHTRINSPFIALLKVIEGFEGLRNDSVSKIPFESI